MWSVYQFKSRIVGIFVVVFGFLYIPAFIYGYFWLWIFPFIAIVTFFVRAMIDSATEQVSKVDGEAKQAKELVPKFIKMNVVMTVLLSIPFISALSLNEFGYIERLRISESDQYILSYSLFMFSIDWMVENLISGAKQSPNIQIMASSLFLMNALSLVLLIVCWRKIKAFLFILLHRESYKFLQQRPHPGRIERLTIPIHLLIITGIFHYVTSFSRIDIVYGDLFIFITFVNFFIFIQVLHIVSILVIDKIQKSNLRGR